MLMLNNASWTLDMHLHMEMDTCDMRTCAAYEVCARIAYLAHGYAWAC